MPDILTIGETLVAFAPMGNAPIDKAESFTMRIAGAESNTAIGLQKLGKQARWCSKLGEDAFGRFVLSEIHKHGVDISHVLLNETHPTGVMFKQPSGAHTTVSYYRSKSAASTLCPEDLSPQLFEDTKILHLTGITPTLSDTSRACVEKAVEYAKSAGMTLSFDPNIRLKIWNGKDFRPLLRRIMEQADIVLLGMEEASYLYEEEDERALLEILRALPANRIAMKCGDRGAWVATKSEQHFIPPVPCVPVDPVGAGDGFNAGFLYGVLEEKSIRQCGILGGIVGALATQTTGDTEGYPDLAELRARYDSLEKGGSFDEASM